MSYHAVACNNAFSRLSIVLPLPTLVRTPLSYFHFRLFLPLLFCSSLEPDLCLSSLYLTTPQGPPGTGKTRTIMGIVGVLLAGGCPFPPGRSGEAAARGGGAIVTVGASLKGNGKGKGKGKKKAKKILTPVEKAVPTRVLIVAPSNAAVDELVLRLCQGGVPSADGGVRFPKVVRVGGGKPDMALGDEGGGGGGGVGVGGDNDGLRSQVVEVCGVWACV